MSAGNGAAGSDPRPGSVAWRVEAADLLTPVAAFLKLRERLPGGNRQCFLLESIEGGVARGRYSVIGMLPDLVWRCRGGRAEVWRGEPGTDGTGFMRVDGAPMESLRAIVAEGRMALPPELPPMVGGLFGYLGYDMVREVERLPERPDSDLGVPDAVLLRPSLFCVFDNVKDELCLAAPSRPGSGNGRALLDAARRALGGALPAAAADGSVVGGAAAGEPVSNIDKERFLAVVERIQEYILAGDAFQVVPSQRFTAALPVAPFAFYRALRRINPAPFLFFLDLDGGDGAGGNGFQLVGSSPEVLVRLRRGVVTIRPLAGTRRRGGDAAEDRALEEELLADPKERAEHLMLVDLGRNDVGRAARPGTVRVRESFAIERFSHVMHISSTVEGEIRDGMDAVDALMAGFPAGTLTGAPKIRAMEIIDEVEPTRRGAYAGCVGYFGADGDMDTCIGLRMAVVKDGQMHVQAGCGVVADSVSELEWEECRQKARALFRAAELAAADARAAADAGERA